jgi:hypothetical protein
MREGRDGSMSMLRIICIEVDQSVDLRSVYDATSVERYVRKS